MGQMKRLSSTASRSTSKENNSNGRNEGTSSQVQTKTLCWCAGTGRFSAVTKPQPLNRKPFTITRSTLKEPSRGFRGASLRLLPLSDHTKITQSRTQITHTTLTLWVILWEKCSKLSDGKATWTGKSEPVSESKIPFSTQMRMRASHQHEVE